MGTYSIIWDFDGTLLPNDPYDSEQSLMIYKLNETGEKIPILLRTVARSLIYADNKELLRKTFKHFYVWFLKGTRITALEKVSERLAEKISEIDRQTLLQLKEKGHTMMVLSCGTADLSEGVLNMAGLGDCFDVIEGNRFQIVNGHITGMTFCMVNPEDKVNFLQSKGIVSDNTIAIGDGYTDIPLLEWAGISVMLDRTGKKKRQHGNMKYRFISSIPEILNVLPES